MPRQRRLHEDAVHAVVGIEFFEQLKQLGLGGVLRQDGGFGADTQLGCGALLHADVDARCGVFSHANEYKARLHAVCLQGSDTGFGLRVDLLGDRAAIDQIIQ